MKIAVCISGQPRNFKKSYTSLKSNFLDKYNCDIFFHSWKTSNFESTNFGGGNHQYNLSEKNYEELIDKAADEISNFVEKTNLYKLS